jgi:hypothetical protein
MEETANTKRNKNLFYRSHERIRSNAKQLYFSNPSGFRCWPPRSARAGQAAAAAVVAAAASVAAAEEVLARRLRRGPWRIVLAADEAVPLPGFPAEIIINAIKH